MKLCFSTLACPEWNLDQILRCARDHQLGVDFRGVGTEIDITRMREFNDDLSTTLELFRKNNVPIPCLNTSVTLISPPDRWNAMLDECQRTALLAKKTDTHLMRIFGGAVPKEIDRTEARSMAHRHLRQLVKIAQPLGVQVLIETHDQWTVAAEVLPLIDGFEPHEVGALWDIEHPHRRGEPPEQTVRKLAERIRHVHVKDSFPPAPGERKARPTLRGAGEVPIVDCVKQLRAIKYDGWYCLEAEKRWIASAPEPEESIPQFARYMREL
jgi:sugar phosphate isomerase/epimerase